MRVGVLGLQGAVSEHEEVIACLGHSPVTVTKPEHLLGVRALILPGGESTTMSRLLGVTGLFSEVKKQAKDGLPMYGTCAGMVLLAKKGDEQVKKTGQKMLGLMDMRVVRNAFGRQRQSFEAALKIKPLGDGAFHGVFIRAPAVKETWGGCRPIAKLNGFTVAAEQGNLLATSFHPELSYDTRLHQYFLEKI